MTTSTGKMDSPIRYAGYQYDSETGLYYLNARYYDSRIARFLSEDTYRGDPKDPLSLNLYAYVKNEPVMYDDPTGHFFNFVAAAVGAAAGAAIGAGIEMARDAAKGQLSKSNWKKYAGAAAAGAITGLTAGLTGGASLVANIGVRAGAGYASSAAEQYITTGKVNQKQALMSSVQSAATYGAGKATNKLKVSSGGSGGTGNSISGKDTLKPGKHAGKSIPARGKGRDFSKEERNKINDIGQNTGCHTCGSKAPGTKSGNFIPDHQPPNSTVPNGTPQQLYPHCKSCSSKQGGTLGALKKQEQATRRR
ncbi:RHS repeat-associated core domain-containing protein [Paenibacillus sp. MAHUQ-46]|uniref:RHS repeat-associated core domain-containing protein n=1 Tax=Paenibacillus roseus TaxID=2798579 RepID=A0A934J322_9BACL|nr:RHS repeat-associated core domain-containing protein [Paenibacillus roseus]